VLDLDQAGLEVVQQEGCFDDPVTALLGGRRALTGEREDEVLDH